MNWYQRRRTFHGGRFDWPSNPADMTPQQAYDALSAYHRSSDCPEVAYTDGDFAIRCAIALRQGCDGLPKCNPAQCRCGAIRYPHSGGAARHEPPAWMEVRV